MKLNPVLMLTRNNLELTKRAVQSVEDQDIDTFTVFFDNGSTDGTVEWFPARSRILIKSDNAGVSRGWNESLRSLFSHPFAPVEHCLVLNNDVVIPPWFYRSLLSYDVPFVTGVAVDDMDAIATEPGKYPLTENPDFSAFLIRRDCWEKVGPFDERMKLYASDCDFHVRAHRLGMPLYKACVPYYHERSSTLNNASPAERQEIQAQANQDRAVFRSLYGCVPGEPAYEELFK